MNPFNEITMRLRGAAPGDVSPGLDPADIKAGLHRVLLGDEWSSDEWEFVDQVSKKLDTTRRLHDSYSPQWSKVSSTEIDEPWRSAFAVTLCNAFCYKLEQDPRDPTIPKRFNVALKAIDYLASVAPGTARDLGDALRTVDFDFETTPTGITPAEEPTPVTHADGILPLTVLFSEGPIARAYLETIASLGLKPRKIVHLVSSVDIATGKPILPWLPASLRKPMAAGMQRSRIFHWPNAIAKRYPDDVSAIVGSVADNFGFAEETLQGAQVNKPLIEYSPSVDTLLVRNLKDEALLEFLQGQADREFLFTGGGIVPQSLLDIPGSRYIHAHPGFLPDIRGADGLLWSVLTRGRPSASAFYMAPGIDTGDILTARWLPGIDVPINADVDTRTRYRMAYAFVDPWVRCCVLRGVLQSHTEFGRISAIDQNEKEGCTYHFMHDHLRALALNRLFPRI
jgi:hypothetical protein